MTADWWRDRVHPTRTPITANQALHATLTLKGTHKPKQTDPPSWTATCPICRTQTLQVTERWSFDTQSRIEVSEGEWEDPPEPPASLYCTNKCAEPSLLAAILSMPIPYLAAIREQQAWRARYYWALDLAQRINESDLTFDEK